MNAAREKVTDFRPASALLAPCLSLTIPLQATGTKVKIPAYSMLGTWSRGAADWAREAKGKMRSLLVAFTAIVLLSGTAEAKVAITVDKDSQLMTVEVDGVQRYRWPVSSGLPSYETPNGSFRAFRMEEDHYSKEFDDAPMPHSIFFTKSGHAIHGTDSVGRLGSPASHGCVRLSRANASTLYALVQQQGVLNTTVTLTGSSQVALARNPRPRGGNTAVARRAPQPQYEQQYDNAGDPVVITPQGQRAYPQSGYPQAGYPQARADDGYIYPADGSSTAQRYPSPRRMYGAQAYPQQQYYYGDSGTYQQAPQGGYYQQQRGLFGQD